MAKRKSTMKNIIYELDNDDIEISSDDEVSGPKVTRTEPDNDNKVKVVITESDQNGAEVLSVDSTDDSVCVVDSPKRIINGGKTSSDVVGNIGSAGKSPIVESNFQEETEIVCVTKSNSDCENSAIFDEDIVVDSPTDLCVAGCENRMPLVSVRFNNSKVSSSCRDKIKKFMINLIKEHQNDNLTNSDNETDYELDIWPDDLVDAAVEEEKQDIDDGLFFVDTAPSDEHNLDADIPKYSQGSSTICNKPEKEKSPPPFFRRGPMCFNCDGAHQLKDCTRPRDNIRIAKMAGQKRNSNTKVGRYHVEDDQKYGHLIPGRISGQLRHALGLKRHELPLFTYRMRLLGYPPGWLEEARISHSGITLFDSTGSATLDPEEEDGEICEAGSKDKYDIKKILDFPGFNVPASSRYSEEAHLYGLPPMSEQDSKIAMLQMLAPNAMKAYKRKKLTFFPSAANSSAQEGLAEMELDSGDEETLFPSVPPLPDEAPPPLPPPPEQPPPPPEEPPLPPEDPESNHDEKNMTKDNNTDKDKINDSDIIEIIEESDATEIPLPDDSFITIDEDYENEETTAVSSSPSIDDLEKQKQALLEALHSSDGSNTEGNQNVAEQIDTKEQKTEAPKEDNKPEENQEDKADKSHDTKKDEPSPADNDKLSEDTNVINNKCESVGTPEPKSGKVKTTSYGTPILNIASSYIKLPSDDKFAKDICDIINFDNLPNSTGKYKQISNLLKKVKTEVDRIQDS